MCQEFTTATFKKYFKLVIMNETSVGEVYNI